MQQLDRKGFEPRLNDEKKMKGKIIFFAGIFMVATGLPLTLLAMNLSGDILDDVPPSGYVDFEVFPGESVSYKNILESKNSMIISAALDPEGVPVNLFVNWDYRNYEILNKTIDASQYFETKDRVMPGEYEIAVTNLGSETVNVDLEFKDSKSQESYDLWRFYSGILIVFYYLFFFGGISVIGIGGIMWRKRK